MARTKKIDNVEKDVAFHVVSYIAQDVEYCDWDCKNKDVPHQKFSVIIKGSAGVIDKVTLKTSKGEITPITPEEYEFLTNNTAFKRHAKRGFVKICTTEKSAKAEIAHNDNPPRDNGSQLTPKDFTERGMTPPTVASK